MKLFDIYLKTNSIKENNLEDLHEDMILENLESWEISEEDSKRIDDFIKRQNEIEKEIINGESPFYVVFHIKK